MGNRFARDVSVWKWVWDLFSKAVISMCIGEVIPSPPERQTDHVCGSSTHRIKLAQAPEGAYGVPVVRPEVGKEGQVFRNGEQKETHQQ